MTPSQERFVRLHQRHFVERCQKLFQGAMVRATTDRGMTATVRLDELESLVASGVVAPAHGGLFVVTPEGARL